jgi:hypothetical protein
MKEEKKKNTVSFGSKRETNWHKKSCKRSSLFPSKANQNNIFIIFHVSVLKLINLMLKNSNSKFCD